MGRWCAEGRVSERVPVVAMLTDDVDVDILGRTVKRKDKCANLRAGNNARPVPGSTWLREMVAKSW